jgi:hypothetical protein
MVRVSLPLADFAAVDGAAPTVADWAGPPVGHGTEAAGRLGADGVA